MMTKTNLSERECRLIVLAPAGFTINRGDSFCCEACGSRLPHSADKQTADYEDGPQGLALCQICVKDPAVWPLAPRE